MTSPAFAHAPSPCPQREAGATLVELLVAMLIGGIVLGMVTTGAVSVLRATTTVDVRTDNVNHARLAISVLSRDIRAAAPPLDSPSTFRIAEPAHARFTARLGEGDVPWLVDLRVEGDGQLVERVKHPVIAADGSITYDGPWTVRYVASYVHNEPHEPVLRYGRLIDGVAEYFVGSLSEDERRQIRLVRIDLSMSRDGGERATPQHLTTEVRVPNMRGSS